MHEVHQASVIFGLDPVWYAGTLFVLTYALIVAERLNRAIGYVFEPGSTMKAVTLAAVLNEGLVTPSPARRGASLEQGGRGSRSHDTLQKSTTVEHGELVPDL